MDRENKVDYAILATPLKRGQIILSYFVSAAVSSVILTSSILVVGLIIIGLQREIYLGGEQILQAFGVVAVGSVSATAALMIVMLFFKSVNASGTFGGILSAVLGFVIGFTFQFLSSQIRSKLYVIFFPQVMLQLFWEMCLLMGN